MLQKAAQDVNLYYPLIVAIASLFINVISVGIMWYQHRLMWRDYKSRHGMNGFGEHHREEEDDEDEYPE